MAIWPSVCWAGLIFLKRQAGSSHSAPHLPHAARTALALMLRNSLWNLSCHRFVMLSNSLNVFFFFLFLTLSFCISLVLRDP